MTTDPGRALERVADALAVLVGRAQAGSPGAVAELRGGLAGAVDWGVLEGALAAAKAVWADATSEAGTDQERRAEVEKVTATLARPGCSRLEALLAGWAAVAGLRAADARRLAAELAGDGVALAVRAALARRVTTTERESAAALRTLRAVREKLSTKPHRPH